jgi:hypothetical protein
VDTPQVDTIRLWGRPVVHYLRGRAGTKSGGSDKHTTRQEDYPLYVPRAYAREEPAGKAPAPSSGRQWRAPAPGATVTPQRDRTGPGTRRSGTMGGTHLGKGKKGKGGGKGGGGKRPC